MKHAILLVLAILLYPTLANGQGACPAGNTAGVTGNYCYFISAQSGSDSNNGTSESTPWANAPAMSTCTNTCASVTPQPGTVFIFKGCDTWNFATIGPWIPNVSGTSGNLIQWGGFDQTWYNTSVCPSGWNRPIFSAEGTAPGASTNSGATWYMMILNENSYWRVAWIEWTGLYLLNNTSNYQGSLGYFSCSTGCMNYELDHNYAHGFTFNLAVDCTQSGANYPCGEPFFFNFSSTGGSGEIDHNVFNGSDTAGTCTGGPGCPTPGTATLPLGLWLNGNDSGPVDYNYFSNADCFVGTFAIFHDNTLNGCGPFSAAANSVHNNVFENNSDAPSGTLFYNNLDENAGTIPNATVSQLAPPSGVTSYYFNNVVTNFLGGQTGGQMAFSCSTPIGGGGGTCVALNNTFECGPDSGTDSPPSLQCMVDGAAPLALTAYANHFITSNSTPIQCYNSSCGTITQVPNPNLAQTLSVAQGQGYNISTYFAPQNSSAATVKAGLSPSALVTQCNAIAAVNAAAGAACEQSTTAGVTLVTSPYYNVGSSTVTPVARLITGSTNNDAGAYQFAATSGTATQPPSGLTATVQ